MALCVCNKMKWPATKFKLLFSILQDILFTFGFFYNLNFFSISSNRKCILGTIYDKINVTHHLI